MPHPKRKPMTPPMFVEPRPTVMVQYDNKWRVELPRVNPESGQPIFEAPSVSDLVRKLCKAIFHANCFISLQNQRIKELELAATQHQYQLNKTRRTAGESDTSNASPSSS